MYSAILLKSWHNNLELRNLISEGHKKGVRLLNLDLIFWWHIYSNTQNFMSDSFFYHYTTFRNSETTLETGNLNVKDEKNVEVIELIPEWLAKSDNCSDFSMTHFFQWRSFLVTSLTHIWVCSFPVWWPRPRRLAVSAVKSYF